MDEINDPIVSIVMCTYNGSAYIKEQLDSLLQQTYPFLEIIIADDCSADNTYAILQQYAADDRIRLYRNEVNLGYTENFTRACGFAKGMYLAISDQDDVWHPDKIKRMIAQWRPRAPLMYCNSVRFTGTVPWNAGPNSKYRRFHGTDSRKLAIFNTISGHAMIVKRSFLQLILPFKQELMYDWHAGVVAASNGGVGYLPDILVFQREHGANVSIGKGFNHNEKEHKGLFNKMVDAHLAACTHVPNMPQEEVTFFKKLSALWSDAMTKKFSMPLFLFLLQHRTVIFWYKKRTVNIFSHLKHSYRLASNQ